MAYGRTLRRGFLALLFALAAGAGLAGGGAATGHSVHAFPAIAGDGQPFPPVI